MAASILRTKYSKIKCRVMLGLRIQHIMDRKNGLTQLLNVFFIAKSVRVFLIDFILTLHLLNGFCDIFKDKFNFFKPSWCCNSKPF